MKKVISIVFCLAFFLVSMAGVLTNPAKADPAAPTGFTVWGYDEDYVILWFDQSDYNYKWKDEYKIFLKNGADQWDDVTDKCVSYWTGNEIYCKHSFQNGQSVTMAVAPYDKKTETVGKKVIADSFTYKTGSFTPIRNLRAKVENDILYAAWDENPVPSGFSFEHYDISICEGDGSKDELGNPDLIYSTGPGVCHYSDPAMGVPDRDKLIVRVSLCVKTGASYYYPKNTLASVELRRGSGGKYSMYRDGQYVDTSDMDFGSEEDEEQPEEEIPPAIEISKTKLTIKDGKSKTVPVTLANPNDSIKNVKTSNKKVAKAKGDGNDIIITPNKEAGKATITVTTEMGAEAKLTVTVKEFYSLNEKSITLEKGDRFKIEVSAFPTSIKAKSFESDKPKVVKVDEKGKITAKKKGKANITVTLSNGKTLKMKVKVK